MDTDAAAREGEERVTTLAQIERDAIAAALMRHGGNRRRVAAELDVARSTLIRKLDEYGLRDCGVGGQPAALPAYAPASPKHIAVRVELPPELHAELVIAAVEQGVPLGAYLASAGKDRAWSRMPSWTRNDPEENQEDLAWDGWIDQIMRVLSEIEAWGEEKTKRLFPRLSPGRRDWRGRPVRIQPLRKRAKAELQVAAEPVPETQSVPESEPEAPEMTRAQKIEAIRARGFGRSRR